MVIRWRPDTCTCQILLAEDCKTFVEWEKKCPGHKALKGQALADGIIAHNASIGPLTADATQKQIEESIKLKVKARLKSVKQGKPEINKNLKND